jgi:hypothetical protein
MNTDANRPHFDYSFRDCADFTSTVLDFHFSRSFKREYFP